MQGATPHSLLPNPLPESSSRFPQRRPHEANLTEGMGSVIAHATTSHVQTLLALNPSPFSLLAIGLGGSHRALSQLLAPFQFVEKSLQVLHTSAYHASVCRHVRNGQSRVGISPFPSYFLTRGRYTYLISPTVRRAVAVKGADPEMNVDLTE